MSWEPVVGTWRDNLITLTNYDSDHKLLNERVCKWAENMVRNKGKLLHMLKLMKATKKKKMKNFDKKFKFGVQVTGTRDVRTTRRLNKESKNTLQFEA